MSKCPYTFVRGLFSRGHKASPDGTAQHLVVRVVRDGEEKVLVTLPAHGARRLLDLIPDDVLDKIRAEHIPIDAMVDELRDTATLVPREIFTLHEPARQVDVWLE